MNQQGRLSDNNTVKFIGVRGIGNRSPVALVRSPKVFIKQGCLGRLRFAERKVSIGRKLPGSFVRFSAGEKKKGEGEHQQDLVQIKFFHT